MPYMDGMGDEHMEGKQLFIPTYWMAKVVTQFFFLQHANNKGNV